MTLYELTGDYKTLYDMADDPEIDEQAWFDTIEGIDGAIEDKADGYAKVIKQLIANADEIKKEEERLAAREEAYRNRADSLKKMLQTSMEVTGKLKFKTTLFSFNVQKNAPSLKISESAHIPEEFLIPQEPKIDKAGMKAAAKDNDGVLTDADGNVLAWLERGQSLRIR